MNKLPLFILGLMALAFIALNQEAHKYHHDISLTPRVGRVKTSNIKIPGL